MLQYVPRFRGKTFLLSIDAAVVESDKLETILLDLALLQNLRVRLVVCFGVQDKIDAHSPIDEEQLTQIRAHTGLLSQKLLAGFRRVGLKAALVNGVEALPLGKLNGIDQLYKGRISEVDSEAFSELIERDHIPLFTPLAIGPNGQFFALEQNRMAAALATKLNVQKWISLGSEFLFSDEVRRQLSTSQAKELAQTSSHFAANWLQHGARACENGVSRVHYLHGLTDGVLLDELFSNEGVGHMIHADEYGTIRMLKIDDISRLQELLRQDIEDTLLLPRKRSEIEAQLEDFFVLEIDGNLVGCIALHQHEENTAEIACLHVRASHENQGHGRRLVAHALEHAKQQNQTRVIALTTAAPSFFRDSLGWEEVDFSFLPPLRKQTLLQSKRNSWVFSKQITTN